MRTVTKMLALAMTMAAVSDASGADGKNYSGTNCVAWFGSYSLGAWSSILNTSGNTWLGVDCPAIKDQASSAQFGWLRVLDRNNDSGVECQLTSAHFNGPNIQVYGSGVAVSTTDSNWQFLNTSGVTGFSPSAYYFSCSVPPVGVAASGINAYHVEEN